MKTASDSSRSWRRCCRGTALSVGILWIVGVPVGADPGSHPSALPGPFRDLAALVLAGCTTPETIVDMALRLADLTEDETARKLCNFAWEQARVVPDDEVRLLLSIRTAFVTAGVDLDRSQAMANELPGNARDLAWAMVMAGRVSSDPDAVLKWLDHIQDPVIRERAIGVGLLPVLAKTNVRRAQELFGRIQADSYARDTALAAIVPEIAKLNVRAAAELLGKASDAAQADAARATAVALGEVDPTVALDFVQSLSPGPARSVALTAAVSALARGDPDRALLAAEPLETDPSLWSEAALAVAQSFLRRGQAGDAGQAAQLARRMVQMRPKGKPYPGAIAQLLAELGRAEAEEALEIIAELGGAQGELTGPVCGAVAVALAASDPEKALAICDRIEDPHWRLETRGEVVAELARADWRHALELARALEEAGTEWNPSPAYYAIVQAAAKEDPEQAFDLAAKNLSHGDRIAALTEVVRGAGDAPRALALAERACKLIGEEMQEPERSYGLARIAEVCLSADVEKGLSWLPVKSDPAVSMTALIEAAWEAAPVDPERATRLIDFAKSLEAGVASERDRVAVFNELLRPLGDERPGEALLWALIGLPLDSERSPQ